MAGKPQLPWPDDEWLTAAVKDRGPAAVARELDRSRGAVAGRIRKIKAREGEAPNALPGIRTGVNEGTPAPWKIEDVIRAHGDDPEKVIVTKTSATRYGDTDDPNHRLRVDWIRESDLVRPPDLSTLPPIPKPVPARKQDGQPTVGMVISDHHAPRHEPTFHRLMIERARERQYDFIEINGDLLDFPDVSQHRPRDDYNHSVNECLRAGLAILRDYRLACPNARITLKRGNHDERLDIKQIDNVPELRKVAPGGGLSPEGDPDERPWHDLRRLLYLDYWRIDYIDEHWEQAKTCPSPKLTLRHGFSTNENAGKVMLDKLSGSTIQGHDHRLALTFKTRHTGDPGDPLEVRLGMSGGCACIIPGGLGYVKGGEPNWQNAAAEISVWPDGDFHASPLIYVYPRLLCPDRRYVA